MQDRAARHTCCCLVLPQEARTQLDLLLPTAGVRILLTSMSLITTSGEHQTPQAALTRADCINMARSHRALLLHERSGCSRPVQLSVCCQ